jgi:hypothetical protein
MTEMVELNSKFRCSAILPYRGFATFTIFGIFAYGGMGAVRRAPSARHPAILSFSAFVGV